MAREQRAFQPPLYLIVTQRVAQMPNMKEVRKEGVRGADALALDRGEGERAGSTANIGTLRELYTVHDVRLI